MCYNYLFIVVHSQHPLEYEAIYNMLIANGLIWAALAPLDHLAYFTAA